jgi:hypothetical protein
MSIYNAAIGFLSSPLHTGEDLLTPLTTNDNQSRPSPAFSLSPAANLPSLSHAETLPVLFAAEMLRELWFDLLQDVGKEMMVEEEAMYSDNAKKSCTISHG